MTKKCKRQVNGVRISVVAILLAGTALIAYDAKATQSSTGVGWKPSITERLVKLPSASIKKAVDKDFHASPLFDALRDTDAEISLKLQTLRELQSAIDQAQGNIQIELKHQFLASKREYIAIVQEQHVMRRKHLETRIKVYQRLLNKIKREAASKGVSNSQILQQQVTARARFKRSVDSIDAKLFATSLTNNSEYSKQYTKNVSAMNALLEKIQTHPHKAKLDVTGDAKNKPDFLRQLMGEAEGDYQVLQQESDIIGLMAKLVALDGIGLQVAVSVGTPLEDAVIGNPGVADSVDLF